MLTRFASFSFTDRRSVICSLTQQLSLFTTGSYYCPILSVAPAIRTQIYMYIYVSDSTTLSLQSFTASLNSVHYLQKGRTIFYPASYATLCTAMLSPLSLDFLMTKQEDNWDRSFIHSSTISTSSHLSRSCPWSPGKARCTIILASLFLPSFLVPLILLAHLD